MVPDKWRWLKPVGWLLLGFVILGLAVQCGAPIWKRYSPDDWLERVQTCAQDRQDFVLLGGSPVSEGLDPHLLAGATWRGQVLAKGYSLGLPGGTTTDVYYAYKQGCPTSPKLVIYGIAPSDCNDSRNEPHGPASLLTFKTLKEATAERPEAASWMTRHFWRSRVGQLSATWQHRHGIRMASAAAFQEFFPGSVAESVAEAQRLSRMTERIRTGNGYAPAEYFAGRRYSDMKASGWVAPAFEALAKYKTGSHLKFLRRLGSDVAASGAELILLEMPLSQDLELRHAAECQQFRQELSDFYQRSPNMRHLAGTRQAVGLTDDDFSDLIHLNAGGAEKLSRWLKLQLEAQR